MGKECGKVIMTIVVIAMEKIKKILVVGRWTCSFSYSQGANADDIFDLRTFHGASSKGAKQRANGEDEKLYAKLLQHLC